MSEHNSKNETVPAANSRTHDSNYQDRPADEEKGVSKGPQTAAPVNIPPQPDDARGKGDADKS